MSIELESPALSTVPRARARATWRPLVRTLDAAAVGAAAKRCFDVAFALVVILATAPILLLAALAIRLESGGPAIYRHPRMGRGGRLFVLFKLRSMYVDAEDRFPELYRYDRGSADERSEFFFHEERDPRITRIGRVIRKFSIDELPNFWNVVLGDMSVVGPRPEQPEWAHLYGDHLERLLSIRPGVTSPAKAGARDRLSLEETLTADLEYVDRHSFVGDLRVIARTAWSVLGAEAL